MTRSIDSKRDLELVRRCLAADERAARELFQELLPQVRGALFRVLGPDPELDDLAQDALVPLFRGLRRFRGDSSLRTWTDRVCVNAALQHLRRRSRRIKTAPMEEPTVNVPAHHMSPEAAAEQASLMARAQAALDRLTPEKRVAFLLWELGGRTAREIADACGAPVSTIKSRIWYARRELHAAAAADPVLREYLREESQREASDE